MVASRLRTTDLPVEDRFAVWLDMATRAHVPTLVETSHRPNFVASIESRAFGAIQVSHLTHPPLQARRTPAMVRGGDVDVLLISHIQSGSLTVHGDRDEVTAEAGTVLVVDTSRPATVVNQSTVVDTVVTLPTPMLGLRRAHLDAMLARPVLAGHGIGGLLAHVMNDLVRNGGTYESAVATTLTTTILDLVRAAARLTIGSRRPVDTAERDRIRRLGIYSYIRTHLTNPDLTPDAVAAAHGISVRQLNRILQDDGTSPSAWIRRERLERCRRELLDPLTAALPIAAIGSRWGFADPVTFNRAFQREYGIPPGEYRRLGEG